MWWEGGRWWVSCTDLIWPDLQPMKRLYSTWLCFVVQVKEVSVWIVLWKDLIVVAPKAKFPLTKRRKTTNLMWVTKTTSCMLLDLPKFQFTSCQESACGDSLLTTEQKRERRSTAFLRASSSSTAGSSCGMSSFFYIWIHVVTPPFALDTPKKKNYFVTLG